MITKTFKVDDLDIKEGSREVVAVISTTAVDRDGEIVLPKGLVKKNYNGNPVVMVNHDYQSLPVGTTRWIKCDKDKIIAKYYISDKTQMARDVFGLLQDGVLKAHSLGFNPIDSSPPTTKEIQANPDWAEAKIIHRKYELFEFSIVNVGCNQEALALCVAKGYSPDTLKFMGYEAPEDCWEFKPVEIDPLAELENKLKGTYCRPWKAIEKRLNTLMTNVADPNELINRLKGKA